MDLVALCLSIFFIAAVQCSADNPAKPKEYFFNNEEHIHLNCTEGQFIKPMHATIWDYAGHTQMRTCNITSLFIKACMFQRSCNIPSDMVLNHRLCEAKTTFAVDYHCVSESTGKSILDLSESTNSLTLSSPHYPNYVDDHTNATCIATPSEEDIFHLQSLSSWVTTDKTSSNSYLEVKGLAMDGNITWITMETGYFDRRLEYGNLTNTSLSALHLSFSSDVMGLKFILNMTANSTLHVCCQQSTAFPECDSLDWSLTIPGGFNNNKRINEDHINANKDKHKKASKIVLQWWWIIAGIVVIGVTGGGVCYCKRKSESTSRTTIIEQPKESNSYIASDLPESDAHLFQYELEQPVLDPRVNVDGYSDMKRFPGMGAASAHIVETDLYATTEEAMGYQQSTNNAGKSQKDAPAQTPQDSHHTTGKQPEEVNNEPVEYTLPIPPSERTKNQDMASATLDSCPVVQPIRIRNMDEMNTNPSLKVDRCDFPYPHNLAPDHDNITAGTDNSPTFKETGDSLEEPTGRNSDDPDAMDNMVKGTMIKNPALGNLLATAAEGERASITVFEDNSALYGKAT